jgi:hypothetical protein
VIALSIALGSSLALLGACGGLPSAPDLSDLRAQVLCRHEITSDCALRAAKLSRHVVAWIPLAQSQENASLLVINGGHVLEKLQVGSVDTSLESPLFGVLAGGPPSTVRWNASHGSLQLEGASAGLALGTLTWHHSGTRLRLDMIDTRIDAPQALAIVATVQYANPPAGM